MNEMTLTHSPQDEQRPGLSSAEKQQSPSSSRSVVLSLIVAVLSFVVLFAGPALALRLMAGPMVAAGPSQEADERLSGVYASGAVTTVVFQQGKYPTTAYTGTKDTYINRWRPTTNFANEARLLVGQSRAYRPLILFDLNAVPAQYRIPSFARIISAQLGIYCYARNIFNSMEAEVYQVKRRWNPLQATWYQATATDAWGTEGCDDPATDRYETPLSSRVVFERNTFHYFDVTSAVQDWVSNPASNKGLILIGPDPAVIYYYYSAEHSTLEQRPKLIITWTVEAPTPTPTPTQTRTPTPGPSPTPTATPGPEVVLDNTSPCYSHTPPSGVWQLGTAGGYGGNYEYEMTAGTGYTARWGPCPANPLPTDLVYEVLAHWSVHTARPVAVPYEIHYDGGTATVYVNQRKNAKGNTVPDSSPSGWYSLGLYPFHAGTYTATGEYVGLNTSSPGDTCADAIRWIPRPGVSGPPFTLTMSANPTVLPADGVATSTIVVTVTDKYGNRVADGNMVGFTTTLGTVPYTYTQAESAAVTKLGAWTEASDPGASGSKYIFSVTSGDQVSWTFWGQAVSLIYATNAGGGMADVTVDGSFAGTINFASTSLQWQVERLITGTLGSGLHTVRVTNWGVGPIWLDALRSGGKTVNGVVTTTLTAPMTLGTARVRAVAIGAGFSAPTSSRPYTETTISFPGPSEVWVDDDYCSGCPNDGHIWNYDAFKTIPGGVDKVLSGGTVHVAAGTYTQSVTIDKPLSLLGAGSGTTIVDGTDAPGSRGFYVDRADEVTISGFKIQDFETGIYLRGTLANNVKNATIMQNKFESNNTGSSSYALRGSYIYTSTLCSNDISLGYNGIYLENAHATTICYNNIYNNQGFGVKIDTGNNNSIDNNNIYDNQNVGVELAGTVLRNGIYGNVLHDLWWDGVLVNGSGGASVEVVANVISRTNQAWLDADGNTPDGYHNFAGILLMGITADSAVYDNRISAVSNAQGHRTDAAGIFLWGNAVPISIETNLIQGCAGHGIYIAANGGNPTIHGNSIYGNGRYGVNNQMVGNVDARGNWWGHNTPSWGGPEPQDITPNVIETPPISLTLAAGPSSIPANGLATSNITATASGFGYNILDGTWITFSSDFSTLVYPSIAAFAAGQANTILRAGTIAGVATITGTAEPGIEGRTTNVTLTALGPHSLAITAYPKSIPVGGGLEGRSVVTATVRDMYENPVPGVVVTFTSNALGGVAPAVRTTLAGTGAATTTFTSGGLTGIAVVTATAGVTLTASTNITITAGPVCTGSMTIAAIPAGIPANGVATSTIMVAMTDCVGNPVSDGTMVGFVTTLGTILRYEYVEAESSAVIRSPGWSVVADGTASGGNYIQTSSSGAAAYWNFYGEAVSLRYRRFASGGIMHARVDGGTPVVIDTSGSAAWLEQVIATNLNPDIMHQIEVTHQSGTIRLDFLRSGAVTNGGRATAILRAPVLPITGTATVYATSRIGHPSWPELVVNTTVVFSQTSVVWVDDNWTGLPNGTPVAVPGGTAYIGNNAFDTIPGGIAAVQPGGTVYVLGGSYSLPVLITKTLNLLGAGSATTFIVGSGPGNGIRVRYDADNVTIEGFTIRNFNYGIYLDGRSTNSLLGITLASNVITGSGTGGITATYVYNSYIANNVIHDSSGFGFDLDTGDNNTIVNNQIYDNTGFGLYVHSSASTSTGNVLFYNNVHDLGLNGISVGANAINTSVLSNTVHTTNLDTGSSGFNEGGIVLYNATNTTVEHNTVYDIRDAGGSSTDTAGIWIGGTDSGSMIRYNRIIGNTNDGILLSGFSSPPEVHCNHIYGHGRFGIRNSTATTVNAEGNWWGRNSPTTGVTPPRDIFAAGNVDYTPRITLTLTAATATVNAGGPAIVITATACGGGCCLLDMTPITFTTNLGGLGSPPTSTVVTTMGGGQATVMFTPGIVAGTATISSSVPNAGLATVVVTVKAGYPTSIVVSAFPTSIPVGTGTSLVTATVRDIYSNLVEDGTSIHITSTLGSTLPPTSSTTSGVAATTLFAGSTAGTAVVRASWSLGPYIFGTTQVEITAGPPFAITSLVADPSSIPANGIATSLLTAIVVDQYGNLVPDGTMVGFKTTAGSMIYAYDEAEGPTVTKVGTWTTLPSVLASGDAYIQTSTTGDSVSWNFRGQAVSLRYGRVPGNGRIRVQVDGLVRVIDTNTPGPPVWSEETMFTGLNEAVTHTITVVCWDAAPVQLDVFRSGAATSSGRALATLTSKPLPPVIASVGAWGIGGAFPVLTTTVEFYAPAEVWVDDDYCSTCFNGGHLWGFDAFSNIPDGIAAVRNWGTVHVLAGTYTTSVTIDKPLYLDGEGSGTTSYLIGSGSGNGIRVTNLADGATIEGFVIRNFNYGIYLDGRSTNRLVGITVTNMAIEQSVSGAITATYVNSGTFSDNAIHNNNGFGFDLDTGDSNQIVNNHIYDNAGFGLRLHSFLGANTSNDNVVSLNNIHDLGWDGIRVGPRAVNTRVLTNTVSNTNRGTGGGFDLGGIVLYGGTDTRVEGNTITYVRAGGGSLADTAGVAMDGSSIRAIVQNNMIRNNVNHGIWISTNGYPGTWPPEIHGNSIYSNGRFGIYNNQATANADAEGNWWGRNTPTTCAVCTTGTYDVRTYDVDHDPWIRLTLTRAPTAIVADGVSTSTITATMRSSGPVYNVLDGTLITLTNSLGTLGAPFVVRSIMDGQATAVLQSGTIAGRSYITATTPSAGQATTWVDFLAGAPFSVTITASPPSIWAICAWPTQTVGSTIEVTVTDQYGNPCAGQAVTYTLSPGFGASLAWTTGVLDANGYHWTALTSGNIAGTILVTATAGTVSRSVPVEIMSGPPYGVVVDRWPGIIAADGVSTATITATARDSCGVGGNLVRDGTMVGFDTSRGRLPYDYVEAESTAVITSTGNWTPDSHASASGGGYIRTDTPGAWARWPFTGSAVSLIYLRYNLGGSARVLVDGVYRKTINMYVAGPTAQWQLETVIANNLDPLVPHTIQVECITGRVYVDALRSGTTTRNGVATAVLTSERAWATAYITATAVDSRLEDIGLSDRPQGITMVSFERANLGIAKRANPINVPAGGVVTFTLFYTNTSSQAQATDTLITDTLPISLMYVSSVSLPNLGTPSNPSDNLWVWHAGNVQPGASGIITFTVRRLCPSVLGLVTNTASVGSLTVDAVPANNITSTVMNFIKGQPFTVALTSTPSSIPTGSWSTITIAVTDECGEPLPATTVYITTNLGGFNPAATLTSTVTTTNGSGVAALTFYGGPACGIATIRATAGSAQSRPLYVSIFAGTPARSVVVANPPAIPADGISTATIAAQVLDNGFCPAADGFFVGFTTSLGSLLYGHVEDSQVNQSPPGSWSTASNAAASGGSYIYTTVAGASVYWNFVGNGVSIVYVRYPGGGIGDVYVDGNPVGSINMDGSVIWRAEKVYTWSGSPTASHTLRLMHRGGSGPIWMDAFRSGVTTYGGYALAALTAAPFTGTATVGATAVSETLGVTVTLMPSFTEVRFEPADLVITKTVQPTGQVAVGSRITYTLVYQNRGPITATNTYIDDVLTSSPGQGDALRDLFFSQLPITVTPYMHYRWSLGSLAAGQSGVITFGGTIDIGRFWPAATVFTNTAVITSSTVDSAPTNNTSRAAITIVSGTPVTLSLTATPDTIPVDGSTSTLQATVHDVYGNPVPNGTPVTFTTSLGGFPIATQYVGYTSNGVATANLRSGCLAGTARITATLDSIMDTTQVIFVPRGPALITVTANPGQIRVGGSTSIIEAQVNDSCGNAVRDGTLVTFTTSAGTIAPTVVGTINGRAFSMLTSANVATTAAITATADSARGTTTVRFVPGIARVMLDASPRSLKVGEVSRATATVRDEFGNLVSGAVVTFTTTLGNFDGFTTTTRTTDSGGRALADLRSTTPGTAIVCASIGVDSDCKSVTFEPGDPYYIEITSVEPGVIPGCGGTATATTIVKDRYNNLVRDGTVVVFDVTPQGDVEPIDGGRTTNGVARAIISSGTVPGPATVWAWPEYYRTSVVDSFGIVFLVGPPDRLELSAEPPRLVVGGNRATIKVRILDCAGYPVTDGTLVTFTIASGQGSLSPQTTTTGNGWAYSYLTSPNETGSATIRVTADERERTVVVEYIPGPPFDITLTADPLSIPANGVSTSTIGAEVKDRYGNHVADRTTVVFTTDLGRFETGASYTTSTLGGRASARLTSSTTSGMARVAATSGGVRREIYVDFYFVPTPTPTPRPESSWYLPIIMKNPWRY